MESAKGVTISDTHTITATRVGKKQLYAVVQCSTEPIGMADLESNFVKRFKLGDRSTDYAVVEVEHITHPLYVSVDYGGDVQEYLCALPRNRWGRYFGSKVNKSE